VIREEMGRATRHYPLGFQNWIRDRIDGPFARRTLARETVKLREQRANFDNFDSL